LLARWLKILNSEIVTRLFRYASFYFNSILIVLSVLFIDAVREIYVHKNQSMFDQEAKNVQMLKEFRAQRNFYITGMALLLWL
jgi:hypothetical protein